MCQGIDSVILIEGNKIEKTNGPGIRIGISNKTNVIRNEIRLNKPGIEVISGDPYIFENKIDKNLTSGIFTYAYSDYRYFYVYFNNLMKNKITNQIIPKIYVFLDIISCFFESIVKN